MTNFNLDCFLSSNNNSAQLGGIWKFGNVSSGGTTPSGWVTNNIVPNPNQLNITNYQPGHYSFTYSVTSPSGTCSSVQTYTLIIPPKIVLTNPFTGPNAPSNYFCVKNGNFANVPSITIPVAYLGNYSWNVSATNGLLFTASSGTGMNSGNIVLTLSPNGVNNLTSPKTSTITLNCNPTIPITSLTGCITSTSLPIGVNNCGAQIVFSVTIGPNFSAGTYQNPTVTICDTNTTIPNVTSLFNNDTTVPTNSTIDVSYYLKKNNTETLITTTTNYALTPTPTNQYIIRRATDSAASPSCSDEVQVEINITQGANSGIPQSLYVCNV